MHNSFSSKKIFSLIIVTLFCSAFLIVSAIAITGQNKRIDISLEYGSKPEYDPDDNGVETVGNIIDFTVGGSSFNWDVDYTSVCTKWSVNTETAACYGSIACCNFISMISESVNWDDPFYLSYGRHGASNSNIVSAKVIHVDYSLNPVDPYDDIVYSKESLLSASFEETAESEGIALMEPFEISIEKEVDKSSLGSTVQFSELANCKTRYWETEEPVVGMCQKEKTKKVCDDEPINLSCHEETVFRDYSCITGTKAVLHTEETCESKELEITNANERLKIDFETWGKCTPIEEEEDLVVICDSKYDGNGDGICQSGESCMKFIISENWVQRYFKNSKDVFTSTDESFFLEKLEVMTE